MEKLEGTIKNCELRPTQDSLVKSILTIELDALFYPEDWLDIHNCICENSRKCNIVVGGNSENG